jgi:hypothetical protein
MKVNLLLSLGLGVSGTTRFGQAKTRLNGSWKVSFYLKQHTRMLNRETGFGRRKKTQNREFAVSVKGITNVCTLQYLPLTNSWALSQLLHRSIHDL